MNEHSAPILIVGGGVGGVAAAHAAGRAGVPCILVEPTDWLGGQLTSQGVPPDENAWVESFGAGDSYQSLRAYVRSSAMADGATERAVEPFGAFNPGGGWVSRCCAEPRRWHRAIRALLAPFTEPPAPGRQPLLRVFTLTRPTRVETSRGGPGGDRLTAVHAEDARGQSLVLRGDLVLDATETGDLLALGGVEHALGAEHADVFGELHGRTDFPPAQRLDPLDQQACSWCFALEHVPGERFDDEAPEGFDWWRQYAPGLMGNGFDPGFAAPRGVPMTPAWCGPLFSWTVPSHNREGRRTFRLVPWPDEPARDAQGQPELEMWRYRRIVDRAIWPARAGERPDVSLMNLVQTDYWQRPLLGVGDVARAQALDGARRQALCFLHWMRTLAPRHDGRGTGYPGLRLRGQELGTDDGFAKAVYVREPRRLVARTILHEGHLGTQQRQRDGHATEAMNWSATPHGTGERFEDSVGIGHYPIDLHPSCAGRNSVYVAATPYRIPMGALIPVRVTNLLASGKCLGVSHVANATTRMHHSEWAVGEAAGTLAAHALRRGLSPSAVHELADERDRVRSALVEGGARITWPWEV